MSILSPVQGKDFHCQCIGGPRATHFYQSSTTFLEAAFDNYDVAKIRQFLALVFRFNRFGPDQWCVYYTSNMWNKGCRQEELLRFSSFTNAASVAAYQYFDALKEKFNFFS